MHFDTPGPTYARLKQELKVRLLRIAGIGRIHIVGCARSGTTMLHYAMVAFAETLILQDVETPVWACPSLGDSMKLLARYGVSGVSRQPRYVVTKRSSQWFLREEIARIVYSTRKQRVFLINIVRDPRDVVTSQKQGREGFYVELERWQRSIEATELLLAALQTHPRVLTIRYEDVVEAPDRTAAVLRERIGLHFRPGVGSFAELDRNLVSSGQSTERASAMHGVRKISRASIGRWRNDPAQRDFIRHVLSESAQRDLMRRFMGAHGYAIEDQASA